MEKLTIEQFAHIKKWIYRNARPLEIARWKYHFEDGSTEEVLAALSAYQNEDGGFGNALEADCWNPNSSPYTTSTAIGILEEVNFKDKNHSIIQGILRYLDDTSDFTGKYWPALIQSNNDYPHAPWWTFADNIGESWGYTPTAKLAGFVLRFGDKYTNIYTKAENIAREATNKYLRGTASDGNLYCAVDREGEIECLRYLLRSLEEAGLSELCNTDELKKVLKAQVDKFITRNPDKWKTYCRKPSIYINAPKSIFFQGNESVMDAELDFILNNKNQDGVWNITWKWGAYEREFAISENWWKANIVIWNMLLLKNFNRLL